MSRSHQVRIENKVFNLDEDIKKLQLAPSRNIEGCNDRIEKQEIELEDFKQQMENELQRIKSKPFAVLRLGRVASAPNLAQPTKQNDPTYFDLTIVRLNSAGIVGRNTVWQVAAKLLAAANINETEVELLPKVPLAKGYPPQIQQ